MELWRLIRWKDNSKEWNTFSLTRVQYSVSLNPIFINLLELCEHFPASKKSFEMMNIQNSCGLIFRGVMRQPGVEKYTGADCSCNLRSSLDYADIHFNPTSPFYLKSLTLASSVSLQHIRLSTAVLQQLWVAPCLPQGIVVTGWNLLRKCGVWSQTCGYRGCHTKDKIIFLLNDIYTTSHSQWERAKVKLTWECYLQRFFNDCLTHPQTEMFGQFWNRVC